MSAPSRWLAYLDALLASVDRGMRRWPLAGLLLLILACILAYAALMATPGGPALPMSAGSITIPSEGLDAPAGSSRPR
jgi:CHASE2 domain-containing sensor protein